MTRLSFGGSAVERSLMAVGYDLDHARVALVETRRPMTSPFETVVAQNAWNVIPRSDFRKLLSLYPTRMHPRIVARRAVSQLNLRRAEKVVALTEYMALLCERAVGRAVQVSPVVRPVEETEPTFGVEGPHLPFDGSFALVPGSVTWYKNPLEALSYLESMSSLRRILFAGVCDDERCRSAIVERSAAAGLEVAFRAFDPLQMPAVYSAAEMVLLPSKMESLGFALAEALLHSRAVAASVIPAHREIAQRLNFYIEEPQGGGSIGTLTSVGELISSQALDLQWVRLGEALNLKRANR